jgi:hypothetical protein
MSRTIRLAVLFLIAVLALCGRPTEANDTITVHKSPNCGCCVKWLEHLRAAGFQVEAHETRNLDAVRKVLGVPRKLAGCHTARIGGLVVEGHVPSDQIQRLLRQPPDGVAGISVPGMPVGSPGMEGPAGRDYDVFIWRKDGQVERFATVAPRSQ